MTKPATESRTLPTPPSARPIASATLPTAADAKVEQARESTATPPTPNSRTPSRSLPRKKLVFSLSFSHTARRQSRSESTQPMPVSSSAAPATRPMVVALSTSAAMSSCPEIPGSCSAILPSRWCTRSSLSSAVPIAAATVSSGKSATKLVKVIAAASRVQCTRSIRS